MTLCVLNSEILASLPPERSTAPHATISMAPNGRAYLTTVTADIAGHRCYLYSETHAEARIPAAVTEAVTAFNADPTVWQRLVAEALDAEDQLLEEDREDINQRLARSQSIRRRLLGATQG